ncbi:MAG: acyltransferase [Bacteroidota bacterium]
MQNLVNTAPAKKNYEFIDAIRGIAMMSIVAEHSIAYNVASFPFETPKYWVYIALIQLTKFGTIAFFLLAGFLIGEKFADYSPAQYLKRRISTTFGPWVFWTLIYLLTAIIGLRIQARIYNDGRFNLSNILDLVNITYLHTSYWFIINFLVSISILLIFRKYLYSLYLGASLLVFTLFYVVNIHYEWVDPRHTTAILGFVFFLWLGAQLRKYWDKIEVTTARVSVAALVFLLLATFAMGIFETYQLHGKSIDASNTLRISNILFSLVAFALMLRIKSFRFVNRFKPRQTTYGIYLIHYVILAVLYPELAGHLNLDLSTISIAGFVLYRACIFVVLYLVTFFVVLGISNSKAKKLVGN